MPDLLVATTLLLLVGAALLAWDAGRVSKNPFVLLGGFALVGFALLARFASGAGALGVLAGLFVDAGLGLLVAAAFLALRRRPAYAALVPGAGLLALGILLGGLRAHLERPVALLVELGPDDRLAEVEDVLRRHGADAVRAFPRLTLADDADLAQVFVVRVASRRAAALADALRADAENVDHVAVDGTVALDPPDAATLTVPAATPLADDPLAGEQWALEAGRVHGAHVHLRDLVERGAAPARRAVVAILDTGVDATHADLGGAYRTGGADDDAHGHGTHCAGIAGAATHNGIGIASLNWGGAFVEVTSYRALPDAGAGAYDVIARAILDAVLDGADVLSMSLGQQGGTAPKVIRDAVRFALERNVVVVASAGNAGRDGRDHMPSNLPGVIAVSALGPDLSRAPFSNTVAGLPQPIAAPGVGVLSLAPGGEYVTKSGTSMAAPFVAGVAGVLRALDPTLRPADVYRLLHETGRAVPDGDAVGRLVDAEAAVRSLVGLPSAPALP